ncbi:MAG: CoA transferase [Saprospiraceae bacterium]|nr:MAG: CoA transferase [Saprospiraceae bacterium]
MNSFFSDLKVMELASVLAGPAVGQFFAELGAEVIKVENKTTNGDITRRWKLPGEPPKATESAYYCSVNWGKKVHLLDLSQESDREQVYKWIRETDIVISNFKLSSAQRMGLDYESLYTKNPRLIYAQLTAFGETESRTAFDVVLQAEAGFLYMSGEAGRPPVKMPVALIDLLAAHQLKEGILLALMQRMKTGKGSYVSTSLLASALSSLANQATNWLMGAHIPQPMGSQHPNIAPYGDIFYTLDQKPIVLAAGTEKQFVELCKCLKINNLIDDARFKRNVDRVKNRQALIDLLSQAIQQETRDELMEKLHQNSVPAGSIRNMQEVFEMPMAKSMILREQLDDGRTSQCVKTVAFELRQL